MDDLETREGIAILLAMLLVDLDDASDSVVETVDTRRLDVLEARSAPFVRVLREDDATTVEVDELDESEAPCPLMAEREVVRG